VEDPYIAESARRHGVSDDDIGHAYRSAFYEDRNDESLYMRIGPNQVGDLLEVGYVVGREDGAVVIVHAMDLKSGRLGELW
jgi:hypothetical protein